MAEEDSKENVAARVFGDYLDACKGLDAKTAEEIAAVASKLLVDAPHRIRQHPRDAVFWAILNAYKAASDDSASPIDRRQCFAVLNTMLGRLDEVKGQPSRSVAAPVDPIIPLVELVSPEQQDIMKERESVPAPNPEETRTAVVKVTVAAEVPPPPPNRTPEEPSPAPQNNLPRKRPAEDHGSMGAARASAPSAASHTPPQSLTTSPLHRKPTASSFQARWTPPAANRTASLMNIQAATAAAASTTTAAAAAAASFPPLPNLKEAPPSSGVPQAAPRQSLESNSAATSATASGRRSPSEEVPTHLRGNSESTRRREASTSGAAQLKPPPESVPDGHLKPPARPQVAAQASSNPPASLAETPRSKDPPNTGGTAAHASLADPPNTGGSTTLAVLASSHSRANASSAAPAGDGTHPSGPPAIRTATERPASSPHVPRKVAAASATSDAGIAPAATGKAPAPNGKTDSSPGSSGGTPSLDAATAQRRPHEAKTSVGSESADGSQSVKEKVPRSVERSETPAVAKAASQNGHDRDQPVPRRERSGTPPRGREAPTSSGAPRRGAASNAKSDLMYLCLQGYNSVGKAERKSFVAQPDTKRFSGAVEERDQVKLEFEQTSASMAEALAVMDRLQRWDPYWEFTGPVLIGKLGRILKPAIETPPPEGAVLNEAFQAKAVKLAKAGKLLRTAMRLTFTPNTDLKPHNERDVFKLIPFPRWHNPQRKTFENGEAHLILRMLPVAPSRSSSSNSSYRTRLDAHIWPKGTFLQHNDTPVKLPQRKQDTKFRTWKHVVSVDELQVLDLTRRIKDPRTEQVLDLCCYDDEPFFYCLSICRYRSHEVLYRSLTSKRSPERLPIIPYDEGVSRIVELAKPVVLDGVEASSPGNDNFAYYSLDCPIVKREMTTPVRGRQCTHFQCFDLMNFLSMYIHPAPSRWRCGVLECDRFVSVRDLVMCQLTMETLREKKAMNYSDRNRVRFDASGSYKFVRDEPKPAPRRQGVTIVSVSTANGRTVAAGDSEPIDLL